MLGGVDTQNNNNNDVEDKTADNIRHEDEEAVEF
jgi:hypothetical protein